MDAQAISPLEYELRVDGASVAARVFADDLLIKGIRRDRSMEQLRNVTALPDLVTPAYGMPDMHDGSGFPVGGVAAAGPAASADRTR